MIDSDLIVSDMKILIQHFNDFGLQEFNLKRC